MRKQLFLILGLLACLHILQAHAPRRGCVIYPDSAGQALSVDTISTDEAGISRFSMQKERPNPVRELFRKKQKLNKKITAAILAFPFPFGIVGLHRIYMGTKPYVPVVYIATVGGVFGILPFIDFCVLMFDKDFKRYENNGKVFMWIKPEEKK